MNDANLFIYCYDISGVELFNCNMTDVRSTNQWTGFYMKGTSLMKELNF